MKQLFEKAGVEIDKVRVVFLLICVPLTCGKIEEQFFEVKGELLHCLSSIPLGYGQVQPCSSGRKSCEAVQPRLKSVSAESCQSP